MEKMNRRDFLFSLGLLLAGVKISLNEIDKYNSHKELLKKEENLRGIYNELPNYVHLTKCYSEEDNIQQNALGIIVNKHYLTMGHIFFNPTINNPQVILNGKNLEMIISTLSEAVIKGGDVVVNEDFAICKLPEDLNLPDFPCKPSSEISLGEDVYLIGNPRLMGCNIRQGKITDLDGLTIEDQTSKSLFGTDINIVPGDSGCPVVNSNFELLGLCSARVFGHFSYIVRIGEFLKYL